MNSSAKSIVGRAAASVHMSSFLALSSHCNNVNTSEIITSNSSFVSLWHNILISTAVTHVRRTCNIPFFNKMTEELCTACCIG